MLTFTLTEDLPTDDELIPLYGSVGWSAYTDTPDLLSRAVRSSHWVVCARDDSTGALIGLARTISDGATIVYLQDILVDPGYQRTGVGGTLLDAVLDRYESVRQFVLLTDADPGQRAFYESRGLVETHDVSPNPMRSFVRLR